MNHPLSPLFRRRRIGAPALLVPLVAVTFAAGAQGQSLVAHYQLNEAAGATVCVDASPNQLNGTYRNVSSFAQGASSSGCGTAVDFDETALSDVIISGGPIFDSLTEDITVCAWVNPNALPAANTVQRIFGNDNGGWTCGLRGDGLIFTTRFVQDYLFTGIPITPMAWNHVAFVFDPTYTVTVYVNGTAMGSVPGAAPANSPNFDWFIGGFDGSIEFFDGLIDDVQVYQGSLSAADVATLAQNSCATFGGSPVGTVYCDPAVPNSTGLPATMSAIGSSSTAQNDLTLQVANLPPTSFAYLLASQSRGLVPQPNMSLGVLCLGGSIGRYIGPGQIQQADAAGNISLTLNLTMMPQPTGFVPAVAGQTWAFQAWYRDSVGGNLESNFSDAYEVGFN